jgi:hypothetical protein
MLGLTNGVKKSQIGKHGMERTSWEVILKEEKLNLGLTVIITKWN